MEPLPLVKGTLDLLVLTALSQAPMHGFEICQWLGEQAGGHLFINDSAVYQAVYRLEARKLVKAEWGITDNNRRARYYSSTPAGRAYLAGEAKRFMSYAATVGGILAAAQEG
jgi:DNA-binding PadR family transcriptional regulator